MRRPGHEVNPPLHGSTRNLNYTVCTQILLLSSLPPHTSACLPGMENRKLFINMNYLVHITSCRQTTCRSHWNFPPLQLFFWATRINTCHFFIHFTLQVRSVSFHSQFSITFFSLGHLLLWGLMACFHFWHSSDEWVLEKSKVKHLWNGRLAFQQKNPLPT